MTFDTFGLPKCLHVPVAAASMEVLEAFVGPVVKSRINREGRINAVLVESRTVVLPSVDVALWQRPEAEVWFQRLHPKHQFWVHVDYNRYRSAWLAFGMPNPGSQVLDHVLNRRAIRLRKYAHPYLRLCPISPLVNTSGGHCYGGEGRETTFMRDIDSYSVGIQETMWAAAAIPLRLADPMDITKMLDIAPGAMTLDGVRDIQHLFYPGRC